MAQITINELSIGFRGPSLLDSVDCQIDRGQRIGLLGRNGAGKTTFMRILSGDVQPDGGAVVFAPQTKVAMLRQDVPQDLKGPAREIIATGLNQDYVDESSQWEAERNVERILSQMELDGDAKFETHSSGMKRRVLLARAIVGQPEVLLLDEPTNHLDINAITWLEEFLSARWKATLLFVTHDRVFLRKLANRIFEIDRGRLFDWSCDYDTFLKRKQAALEAEDKQNALFDKKLAEEEAWIRQGIKARRTRNEGRVRALQQLRRERADRRTSQGKVNLKIDGGQRSGNLVAEVKQISFAFENLPIVQDFSATVMRGDKIGIVGPNGVGKTTLLRILLGKLEAQSGRVRMGTNLQIAYFDQLREQLNETQTVQENVGEGSDTVEVGGSSKHVIGYLQDFLFNPERSRTPVRFLSGGERNRVLLAKLFSKPANVIVLDEPTNDLDTETLELLEERLVDYDGTLFLVSHDRAFLNNVVTSTFAFESPGKVKEYVGGYDDWIRQRSIDEAANIGAKAEGKKSSKTKSDVKRSNAKQADEAAPSKRRLSYKEQKELEALPKTIERLEAGIAEMHTLMAEPSFYQKPGPEIATEQAKLSEMESDLATAYERWEALDQ